MNRVLVIAAHPDDEILGCGATLYRHVTEGDQVRIVIMGEGLTSRGDSKPEEHNLLRMASLSASLTIGVTDVHIEGLPDNLIDSIPRLKVIKIIERHIENFRPNILYTHHVGDVNVDHQILHHSVVTAARSLPNQTVELLLFFETPSSTEWQVRGSGSPFEPQWFVDVSGQFDRKLKALMAYESELRDWPHPRSIAGVEALATWRGSQVGVHRAEAFMLGRHIRRAKF